jgi:DNA-binding transcriptional regulator YbjK
VPVPLGEDRRAAIADAAIRLVADRGLKGLTHRAVDAEAGLPPGSTSYYLRTRDALLTACVNRMVERDRVPLSATPTGLALDELLVRMVLGLASDRRDELVARYELSLEAIRRPALRQALVEAGTSLRDGLTPMLAASGIADAAAMAWPVAAMLDGLMYDRVAGAGTSLTDEEFEAAIRRAVAALLDGLTVQDARGDRSTPRT